MPSNFTLNNLLSSTSYNSNVGYNNSWIEVQSDTGRPLYAQASYITNNKVSDWGVTSALINASTYTQLSAIAANTVTFTNNTGVTVYVGKWVDASSTVGIPVLNNTSITLNLVNNTSEVAFKSASNTPTVYVVYSNMC